VVALVVYGAALSTTVAATIGVVSLSAAGLVEPGETLSTLARLVARGRRWGCDRGARVTDTCLAAVA
jgi:hypothetical protein